MPVIVIGADTPVGHAVVAALLSRPGEIRAFVSDAAAASWLKERNVKVAIGDVSDASHVGSAAINAFSAVLIAEAALDERERAFASSPEAVVAAWAEGLADAGVRRGIWIGNAEMLGAEAPIRSAVVEMAAIDGTGRDHAEIAAEAAALDEASTL